MKTTVILCALVSLCLLTASGQTPSAVGGNWYGSVNPPNMRFDIAVSLQNIGGWTGSLLMENGISLPLSNLSIDAKTISFSIDRGGQSGEQARFKGTIKDDEITGEFTQDNSTVPFQLSRKPTAALVGAAIGIDPKEMIEAITEFKGSLSD